MIRMLLATTLAFAIGGASAVSASPIEPTLDQVRAATEKYQDVKAAIADGYVRDPMDECVTAASIGYPPEFGCDGNSLCP